MRKEVDLCDKCERTISDGKCSSCGNDCCDICSYMMAITFSQGYGIAMQLTKVAKDREYAARVCKPCYKAIFDKKTLKDNPKPLVERIIKAAREHTVAMKV